MFFILKNNNNIMKESLKSRLVEDLDHVVYWEYVFSFRNRLSKTIKYWTFLGFDFYCRYNYSFTAFPCSRLINWNFLLCHILLHSPTVVCCLIATVYGHATTGILNIQFTRFYKIMLWHPWIALNFNSRSFFMRSSCSLIQSNPNNHEHRYCFDISVTTVEVMEIFRFFTVSWCSS